jgi:SAM-dependent methyltransferase
MIRTVQDAIEDILGLAAQEESPLPQYFLHHLRVRPAVMNYGRIALECAKHLCPGAHVLDWGSGHGQNTYLLRAAGLQVTPYDIVDFGPGLRIKQSLGVDPIIGKHPTDLPFPDGSFDAILSCGCLEHVEDPSGSIREIYRVIRPGGLFFIYFLPNLYSYTEMIATLRGRSDHPVKYTPRSLQKLMAETPFVRLSWHYHNLLPKNLTGLPAFFRGVYNSFPTLILNLESMLLKIPGLRIISGTIEAAYQKPTNGPGTYATLSETLA